MIFRMEKLAELVRNKHTSGSWSKAYLTFAVFGNGLVSVYAGDNMDGYCKEILHSKSTQALLEDNLQEAVDKSIEVLTKSSSQGPEPETRIFVEQGTGKTFECKELPKD